MCAMLFFVYVQLNVNDIKCKISCTEHVRKNKKVLTRILQFISSSLFDLQYSNNTLIEYVSFILWLRIGTVMSRHFQWGNFFMTLSFSKEEQHCRLNHQFFLQKKYYKQRRHIIWGVCTKDRTSSSYTWKENLII